MTLSHWNLRQCRGEVWVFFAVGCTGTVSHDGRGLSVYGGTYSLSCEAETRQRFAAKECDCRRPIARMRKCCCGPWRKIVFGGSG